LIYRADNDKIFVNIWDKMGIYQRIYLKKEGVK